MMTSDDKKSTTSQRTSFTGIKEKPGPAVKNKCSKCNKTTTKPDLIIQCSHCKLFNHYSCTNLLEADVELFKKNKDMLYFCESCMNRSVIAAATPSTLNMDYLLKNINESLRIACENMLVTVKSEVQGLKDVCKQQIDDFIQNNDVSELQRKVEKISCQVDGILKAPPAQVVNSKQSDDVDRLSRLNNILINGMPSNFDNQQTMDAICGLCSALGANIVPYDISYWRKISVPNKQQSTVVVCFLRRFTRDLVLNLYYQFIKKDQLNLNCLSENLPRTRIFFDEHLTKENSNLFFLSRQLRKKDSNIKVFVHQGLVYVVPTVNAKPVLVKNAETLDSFGVDPCNTSARSN